MRGVEESLDWPNAMWTTKCGYATLRDVASPRLAGVPEMYADGVVYMMGAFGSGGRFGLIIALSHRCHAIAAMTWQWWWRDFDAQQDRRTDRRAIPADCRKTCVYLDLRVGGRLVMWEGSFKV